MLLRLTTIIAIWIVTTSVYDCDNTPRPVFGVRVAVGPNSSINQYACFILNNGVLTKKRTYDEKSFIKIVSGKWPSIYNPDRVNFFDSMNVNCGVLKDSVTLIEYHYCQPLDSLWKLRYEIYPFRGVATDQIGWTGRLNKPSLKQEKYLYDRYNVGSIDAQYFVDTSFWMLLQDVQDPAWVASYKAMQ